MDYPTFDQSVQNANNGTSAQKDTSSSLSSGADSGTLAGHGTENVNAQYVPGTNQQVTHIPQWGFVAIIFGAILLAILMAAIVRRVLRQSASGRA